jgi:hypothetical protein
MLRKIKNKAKDSSITPLIVEYSKFLISNYYLQKNTLVLNLILKVHQSL